MKEIKKKYHLIIYTASDQSYADSVLDFIDPMSEYFSLRLYRHNCVKTTSDGNTLYIKDLRIIRNVKLKNIVIIDNSVLSFAYHLDNGIPILPYYNNKKDREMICLKDYLMNLSNTKDFRKSNSKIFNLRRLLKETAEDESPISGNSPKEEDSSDSNSSEEDEFVSDIIDHDKLDKKLNKPVRKESKFQVALSETLQNAHKNVINVIKDVEKEEKDEINSDKKRVGTINFAQSKSRSTNSIINISSNKRRSQISHVPQQSLQK